MEADAYFSMGVFHDTCEDYAISKRRQDSVVVALSDGCSSSKFTDVGARLLCHEFVSNETGFFDRAKKYVETINLPQSCLDATLLTLAIKDKVAIVSIAGDGVLAIKDREGNINVMEAVSPKNCPAYLSYLVDSERLTHLSRLTEFKYEERLIRIYKDASIEIDTGIRQLPSDFTIRYEFPIDNISIIVVFSDGINSFRNSDGTYAQNHVLIPEILNIKTTTGQFVTRRLKAFLRDQKKLGFFPEDDVSMAAIAIGQ